jgi:hypothetical protein
MPWKYTINGNHTSSYKHKTEVGFFFMFPSFFYMTVQLHFILFSTYKRNNLIIHINTTGTIEQLCRRAGYWLCKKKPPGSIVIAWHVYLNILCMTENNKLVNVKKKNKFLYSKALNYTYCLYSTKICLEYT